MKTIDQEKTREKIVALRTERGLSQNQLAEALVLHVHTITASNTARLQ